MASCWTWLRQLAGGTFMENVMRETTRVCDRLAPRNIASAQQREIARWHISCGSHEGFKTDRHKKTGCGPSEQYAGSAYAPEGLGVRIREAFGHSGASVETQLT